MHRGLEQLRHYPPSSYTLIALGYRPRRSNRLDESVENGKATRAMQLGGSCVAARLGARNPLFRVAQRSSPPEALRKLDTKARAAARTAIACSDAPPPPHPAQGQATHARPAGARPAHAPAAAPCMRAAAVLAATSAATLSGIHTAVGRTPQHLYGPIHVHSNDTTAHTYDNSHA